jgi:hypothetical protein
MPLLVLVSRFLVFSRGDPLVGDWPFRDKGTEMMRGNRKKKIHTSVVREPGRHVVTVTVNEGERALPTTTTRVFRGSLY